MNNDKQQELFKEFKKMSPDELNEYEGILILLCRSVNIIGVIATAVVVFNLSFLFLIIGAPIILLLAATGTALKESLIEVRRLLGVKDK